MLAEIMLTTRDAGRLRLASAMAKQAERVGERLTEAREALGVTRSEMAERFDETSVTDDYIYRWETGRVMPSEAYQAAIIEHYELDDLADLFGGAKAKRPKKGKTPARVGAANGSANQAQLDRIEERLDAIVSALVPLLAEQEAQQLQSLEAGKGARKSSTRRKRAS